LKKQRKYFSNRSCGVDLAASTPGRAGPCRADLVKTFGNRVKRPLAGPLAPPDQGRALRPATDACRSAHGLGGFSPPDGVIVLIGVSRTPDRCIRCPSRSPIPPCSHVCASAGTIVSADSSTNTTKLPDLRGRDFRHPQASEFDHPQASSARDANRAVG
jgi:hypothetical protein